TFTRVGGQARGGLAHIRGDHSVAPWNPGCNGNVLALARLGSTVFVGGAFSELGGQSRSNLAGIDGETGDVTSWDPGADAPVLTLTTGSGTVYAGGQFTTVAGVTRYAVVRLDPATGAATAFDAQLTPFGAVYSMASESDHLVLGGYFFE